MTKPLLELSQLAASAAGVAILRGVSLTVGAGELHVLMGPNGAGKSTLAGVLAGHPGYQVTGGTARFCGDDLLALAPDERARRGLFLAFQYPVSVPGVSLTDFLIAAVGARQPAAVPSVVSRHARPPAADAVAARLQPLLADLRLAPEVASRDVNGDLSGGEKKKSELVQLGMLQPRLALLDEPDSGLDVDALRSIAAQIARHHKQGMAIVLITHYNRILAYLKPDQVHVMASGRIVRSGGADLAEEVERGGYEPLVKMKNEK